jgi:hypothetical protein
MSISLQIKIWLSILYIYMNISQQTWMLCFVFIPCHKLASVAVNRWQGRCRVCELYLKHWVTWPQWCHSILRATVICHCSHNDKHQTSERIVHQEWIKWPMLRFRECLTNPSSIFILYECTVESAWSECTKGRYILFCLRRLKRFWLNFVYCGGGSALKVVVQFQFGFVSVQHNLSFVWCSLHTLPVLSK